MCAVQSNMNCAPHALGSPGIIFSPPPLPTSLPTSLHHLFPNSLPPQLSAPFHILRDSPAASLLIGETPTAIRPLLLEILPLTSPRPEPPAAAAPGAHIIDPVLVWPLQEHSRSTQPEIPPLEPFSVSLPRHSPNDHPLRIPPANSLPLFDPRHDFVLFW